MAHPLHGAVHVGEVRQFSLTCPGHRNPLVLHSPARGARPKQNNEKILSHSNPGPRPRQSLLSFLRCFANPSRLNPARALSSGLAHVSMFQKLSCNLSQSDSDWLRFISVFVPTKILPTAHPGAPKCKRQQPGTPCKHVIKPPGPIKILETDGL